MPSPERQTAHLIEQTLQNNTALLLTAPQKKGCYVIAPVAGEMSLQSLRLLVNASKTAGAGSIFLFLIVQRALQEANGGGLSLIDAVTV